MQMSADALWRPEASGPLELELQMAVSGLAWVLSTDPGLWKSSQVFLFLTTEPAIWSLGFLTVLGRSLPYVAHRALVSISFDDLRMCC